jgi:hypothetical protein
VAASFEFFESSTTLVEALAFECVLDGRVLSAKLLTDGSGAEQE